MVLCKPCVDAEFVEAAKALECDYHLIHNHFLQANSALFAIRFSQLLLNAALSKVGREAHNGRFNRECQGLLDLCFLQHRLSLGEHVTM
jgi:hypothetical protein